MQGTRTVQLVYLARLRESFGRSGEAYELDADVRTIADLMRALSSRGGAWSCELAPGRAFRVAVNHEVAAFDTRISPGDEIAVFPPVTGG